ncbi:MAG: hypothetical protein HDT25_00910 [Ruminococcus sp.]|nr:hypothetical protein [Ruminococcus sp.]
MKNKCYTDMVNAGYFDTSSNNYIWIRDMEWISEKKSNIFFDFIPEDAIPFAVTGGGDVWVADNDSEKIFLYYHDDDEPEYYADSFENAVFRQLVEFLSDNEFVESSNEEDENSTAFAKKYIRTCCNIFKPYFLEEQTEILLELVERTINEYKNNNYIYHSFLDFDKEASKIISKFIVGYSYGEANENKCDFFEECNSAEKFVSDSRLLEIKGYCFEMSKKYAKYVGISDEAKEKCHEVFYKKGCNDIHFYRLNPIFETGKFDTGIQKKSADECKDDFIKYYLDDENYPIYAEHYLDGSQKPPFSCRVYFRENNKMVFSEYRQEKNGVFVYMFTEENSYDKNGKLMSFIKYDEHKLYVMEDYHYIDGKLLESVGAESYSFDCDIGDDTYRLFPNDDKFDELFDGGMNPQMYISTKYIYENNMIVSAKRFERNDDGVIESQYDIDKKTINALVKKGLI